MRGLVVSSSSSSEDNIRLERSRLEQVNINTETERHVLHLIFNFYSMTRSIVKSEWII